MAGLGTPGSLRAVVLCALLAGTSAFATEPGRNAEDRLRDALELVVRGDLSGSMTAVETLLSDYPNFHLAHLVNADLQRLSAGQPPWLLEIDADAPDSLEALKLEFEHRFDHAARWQEAPPEILHLGADYPVILVADLSHYRLYLYRNGGEGLEFVRSFYAAIGEKGPRKQRESDLRTPVGVYFIDSYIDGSQLPDLYGYGALPLNYPNVWDRRQGYTGHGIWVHGTPSTSYNRPPMSSEGCVTLSNQDFEYLKSEVDLDITPIVIGSPINWGSDALADENAEFMRTFDGWRASHGRHLSRLSVLRHPHDPVIVVTFLENRSDGRALLKRQYWRKDASAWQRFFEGDLETPASLRISNTVATMNNVGQ